MSIITVLVSRNCDIKFKNMKHLFEFDSTGGLSRLISRSSESSVFLSICNLNNMKFKWVIFNSHVRWACELEKGLGGAKSWSHPLQIIPGCTPSCQRRPLAGMLHLSCVRSIKFYLLLLSNKAPIKHSLVPLIECCSEGVLQLASPCFPPQKAFGSFPLDFPLLQKSSAVANTSLWYWDVSCSEVISIDEHSFCDLGKWSEWTNERLHDITITNT